MIKLTLDAEDIYASRAINRQVLFDADGTKCECIIIVSNSLTEFHGIYKLLVSECLQ